MRVVIQRVSRASVSVDNKVVSQISSGLVLLLGISATDTRTEGDSLVKKCLRARLWPDASNPQRSWASSVLDNDYEVLVISQFTLYGTMKKGNKPDFHLAMGGDAAKELYAEIVELFRQQHKPERIKDGVFGAMMEVDLVNDGPVTIIHDTNTNNNNGDSSKEASSSGASQPQQTISSKRDLRGGDRRAAEEPSPADKEKRTGGEECGGSGGEAMAPSDGEARGA
ncbi:unnamed protein product [Vitrella brassicaformis CCMP3155]|uniref:D-aminoacyl-tRNA deacylase n=1 Tax=Vitrella brassicaformis (strain CCMP3155) TaxID=1169540 RepID=A0A0G4EKQ9_VITBC|nr:unnamed protein product [Vitrella brassicaformis CCMP3155]|eukprot:CEL97107.1 unnamed protein product [Vitrella brassicaformis CCMP3155]